VTNLVQNALEALAPDPGTLRVGVRHDAARDEVVLVVSDTGPGLDPALRDRLFEPYFSTKTSGTGLGLAIARRAVEAHGGRIEVGSEPERGTTFEIRLPVAGARPTASEPDTVPALGPGDPNRRAGP
jgi:signal transduction histidine kinase